MKTDDKLIIIPDYMIFLISLGKQDKSNVIKIFNDTKISYSHLHHIKKAFQNKGWITITKFGKSDIMSLTDKGRELLIAIKVLFDQLGINEDNIKEFRGEMKHDINTTHGDSN